MRPEVRGHVVIPGAVTAFAGGSLRVWIEETSYADAPARVIGMAEIVGIAHEPRASGSSSERQDTRVPFSVTPTEDIQRDRDYSVRAVLATGAGAASGPVLRTDRSYPVLTRSFGTDVTVVLA